jgi:hypothetical protein
LIYLEPLGWVGGPIILLDSLCLEIKRSLCLEIKGPAHLFQVAKKSFDSSWVIPSFRGALPVRLVIVATIIIIDPIIVLFLFNALSLSAPIFNPAACISVADDVMQVTIVSPTPSAVLLWWSDAAGRVPMRTLLVVKLMIPVSIFTDVDRIHHGCRVHHRLEALDMRVDFFIIFG